MIRGDTMKSEREKYLVEDLEICFRQNPVKNESEEQDQDYFLIGYSNTNGDKFKDIVTGRIVEEPASASLRSLSRDFRNNGYDGINMAVGYMTLYGRFKPSIHQKILGSIIGHKLGKPIIDIKDIEFIKDRINWEIEGNMEALESIEAERLSKMEQLDAYSVKDSEREF